MKKDLKIDITKILPHRYPFLLVDKVIDFEENVSVTAIKNVTYNEYFFQGHFPDNSVMPGVLILEALAQTCAIGVMFDEKNLGKTPLFVGADKVKFRRMVFPGDVLELKGEILKYRGNFGKAKCVAKVGDEIACEAEISFAIS